MNPAELDDALARCHESPSIRNRLAEEASLFLQRKRYTDALRIFDAIVDFDDLDPAHYCNATWLVQKDNTHLDVDAARSRRYLAACLPHAPGNPAIFLNAAAVFTELDEIDEAISQLLHARERGLDITPFLSEPLFAPLTRHARWAELASPQPAAAPTPADARAVPAWAELLDAEEYAAFRALVIDHLRDWFLPFDERTIDEGRVEIKIDFVREVRRFELEPLARRCHETPRAQWKVHVTEWLRFAAGSPAPAPALPPRVTVSAESLEPETEAFVLRHVPGLADAWRGATREEIDELERRIERPLPRFYRWFLSKMGHDMGPLGWGRTDFTIGAVLERAEAGDANLMIGIAAEDIMPLDTLYDLDQPARDDAQVWNASGGPEAETFRERLVDAWLDEYRIDLMPSRRMGFVRGPRGDVLARLQPVMKTLGFEEPVPTGPFRGFFERDDAAMSFRSSLDDGELFIFSLGCADETITRAVLRVVAATPSLTIEMTSLEM
jgi:hypothetical protein